MKLCLTAIALGACLLAGCATTDATRGGAGADTRAYDDGYYVAARDGFGDYWYDRPQVVASYDSWSFGTGFGWDGGYGFGFAPWSAGYPFWFGVPPWYWHRHHHPGHRTENLAHADAGPAAMPTEHRPRPAPPPFPDRQEPGIRAPHHGFQHSRP